jgi:hypothetical protein
MKTPVWGKQTMRLVQTDWWTDTLAAELEYF